MNEMLRPIRRLAWLSDIHLTHLNQDQLVRFVTELSAKSVDAFAITGDIGDAKRNKAYLTVLDKVLRRPIYFVYGNHDYYFGSVSDIRRQTLEWLDEANHLHWLPQAGVIPLSASTCLIGHDGWGDGRNGDHFSSTLVLNDFILIDELRDLDSEGLLRKLNTLGDESAAHFDEVLPRALESFRHIYVLIHVPPFKEAAWWNGTLCSDEALPYFSCQAVGRVLKDYMERHPRCRMTVLCGHTHCEGTAQILDNLVVKTASARYGSPEIYQIIEIE